MRQIVNYTSLEEELTDMERYLESNFVLDIKYLEEVCRQHFVAYESEYGFVTNAFSTLLSGSCYGFNMDSSSFLMCILKFLADYDLIFCENKVVSIERSNDPDIAELLIKLIKQLEWNDNS